MDSDAFSLSSTPRMKSWSPEYARKRRKEKKSLKLEPLNEEALGEARKARQLDGLVLRRLREQRGVDLETICNRTKINIQ